MSKVRQPGKKDILVILIFSFCAAIATTISFKYPVLEAEYTVTAMSEILWNLKKSLLNTASLSTVLFVCFFYMGIWLHKEKTKKMIIIPFCSFFIAVVWLMGKSYSIDNSLASVHSSAGQVVKAVIYVSGIAWLLNELMYLFYWLTEKYSVNTMKAEGNKIIAFYNKHPLIAVELLVLICWLPHIIVAYPGYVAYDAWVQLFQYFDLNIFTSHHPPMHTLLLGWLVDVGLAVKDWKLGLMIFVIFQVICGSLAFSYSVCLLKKLRAPQWLIVSTLISYAFVPFYFSYVNVLLKDNLYSYAFLLFITELVYLFILKEDFFKSKRHTVLLLFSTINVLLLRNNGKYVIYAFTLLLVGFFALWLILKKIRSTFALKTMAVLSVSILVSVVISSAITSYYDITPGSKREALSLPFQQTARYVSAYKNEITEEEAKAISAVLDYENLPELYDPRISDPVKATYKDEATTQDLINYVKVWLKQLFKHPLVYIQATVNQNYYLLYPRIENNITYFSVGYSAQNSSYAKLEGFESVVGAVPDNIQMADAGYGRLMYSIPVIGLLSNPAFYVLVLIAILIYALYKKKTECIIVSVPLILSVAIVVLAPVIQGQSRYMFPVIFSMPVFIAYYLYLNRIKSSISKG